MKDAVLPAVLICLSATGTLYADFSYQQNTQITGGALAGMMKLAGAFSKQAREPIVSHTYVKGHRLAHVSQHSSQITDVDKETVTNIDFDRRSYTVMTFEQMKQQFEQMSKDMQDKKAAQDAKTDKDVNLNMNVSAKNTGQTKDIAGLSAKELVLTMSVQGVDPQSGQTGSMDIRSDMWMAKVDGYDEVRDLYKLMSEKLGFVTSSSSFLPMQRPDLVKNMGELYKEMGKMEGMPVETVVSFGATGAGASSASTSAASASPKTPTASDAAVATAMSQLGGLAGALGGFGHKKKKTDDSQQQQSTPQSTQAPAADASQTTTTASLMEMTTQASDFSAASLDESHFAVPDGFKQVDYQPKHQR